ncbi:unnamed protein product [marine sediment metagenome]|uniref:Uncharacterized protein n=1 Tax=marine sediment metagenome TaxID=412755 RepID=X0ZZ69_9ZZZZ
MPTYDAYNVLVGDGHDKCHYHNEANKMHQPFSLRCDALAAATPLQEDKDNPAAIQGREWEYIDYSQVYAEEGGKFQ